MIRAGHWRSFVGSEERTLSGGGDGTGRDGISNSSLSLLSADPGPCVSLCFYLCCFFGSTREQSKLILKQILLLTLMVTRWKLEHTSRIPVAEEGNKCSCTVDDERPVTLICVDKGKQTTNPSLETVTLYITDD